uniref:Uncharacterized protein n=1 Tax=Melopsittacus undulatus TaxID=13146 RepID=A0A8V5HHZ2_MELUD
MPNTIPENLHPGMWLEVLMVVVLCLQSYPGPWFLCCFFTVDEESRRCSAWPKQCMLPAPGTFFCISNCSHSSTSREQEDESVA